MNKIKKIVFVAIMLSCHIVLSRFFSIKTSVLFIGFGFVPLMLVAVILGAKYSSLVGLLGDLIGALLFPSGAYFPGFTVSSFLSGLIYGLILYKKKSQYKGKSLLFRLLISSIIVNLLVNGVLNTVWLYMITKKAFLVLLPTRIIKQLIMIPVETITMYLLFQNIDIKMIKND